MGLLHACLISRMYNKVNEGFAALDITPSGNNNKNNNQRNMFWCEHQNGFAHRDLVLRLFPIPVDGRGISARDPFMFDVERMDNQWCLNAFGPLIFYNLQNYGSGSMSIRLQWRVPHIFTVFLYFGLSASAFAIMQSPDCKNKQTNGTTSVSKVLVKKQTMSGFRCWSLWYIWELLGLLQIKRSWVCVTAVTRLYFWVASRSGPFRQINNHRR